MEQQHDEGAAIMRLGRAVTLYTQARRGELTRLTLREIRYHLDDLTYHLGPDTALKAVQPKHIQNWLAHHDWAPSTARSRLSTIRTFFTWTLTNSYTKTNPAALVRGPKQPRALPRELDTHDARAVLAAAADARAAAIVSLMFREGLRRAEIHHLDVGDFDRQVVCVTGKGGHERVMPLSEESFDAIHRYLTEHPAPSGPLFRNYQHGTRLTPPTIGDIAIRAFIDAGVKQRAHDGRSGHAARHTFAGAMLDAGADIRDVSGALGHAHLSTTAIYLKRRQTVARIRPYLPQYGSPT